MNWSWRGCGRYIIKSVFYSSFHPICGLKKKSVEVAQNFLLSSRLEANMFFAECKTLRASFKVVIVILLFQIKSRHSFAQKDDLIFSRLSCVWLRELV